LEDEAKRNPKPMKTENANRLWVSFCMTTRRRPDFLIKTLRSIQRQTISDFEVIVSDNDTAGSGGPVEELIRRYKKMMEHVKFVVRTEREGELLTLNNAAPLKCPSPRIHHSIADNRSFKGLDHRPIQLIWITIGSGKQCPISDGKQYSA
jgi:Glycosyl transferase family 2